ncbi:pEARLI1-like lipid transfer protein 2 [Miscanthus floridulus]|uniref:pEARLI1-like lipid transfer protein 2 n=1 Tax=Miscanthus floridulus TaxID=154761 RepID=UPI003458FFB5
MPSTPSLSNPPPTVPGTPPPPIVPSTPLPTVPSTPPPTVPSTPPPPTVPSTPLLTVLSTPPPPPAGNDTSCPIDALKLRMCANLMNGLVRIMLGLGPFIPRPEDKQCCPLLWGLTRLDAATCVCTAIRARVIPGIVNLYVPLSLGLLLSGKDVPPIGLSCPLID